MLSFLEYPAGQLVAGVGVGYVTLQHTYPLVVHVPGARDPALSHVEILKHWFGDAQGPGVGVRAGVVLATHCPIPAISPGIV